MNFRDFFNENSDYTLAYQCHTLAQDVLDKLMEWGKDVADFVGTMSDSDSRMNKLHDAEKCNNLRRKIMDIMEIQTTEHKVYLFIKQEEGNTLGSAKIDRSYDSHSVNVYNNSLRNSIEMLRMSLRAITENVIAEKNVEIPANQAKKHTEDMINFIQSNYKELTTTIGHEIAHLVRIEKDIVSGRTREELNKIFLQSDNPDEEERKKEEEKMKKDYLKATIKKYQHEIYTEHAHKIKKVKWYALFTYIKYSAELKRKLSEPDFEIYCNSVAETDARFIDALFPFLKTNYSDFTEMMEVFIENIGAYWEHLTIRNQNKMRKRLFKFWEFKQKGKKYDI